MPQDEKGPVKAKEHLPIHRPAPSYEEQAGGQELLVTGIKVIDLLIPFAKGGKVGLFGGAGVGKTVTMLELINNIAKSTPVCPCSPASASAPAKATTSITRCRVGRHRHQGPEQLKVALVYGQMNEPPGNRLRVALTGLTMAEYFRDEKTESQGPRRAAVHRQHLPLHAGRHRSVGAARPYAFGGGLSADARRRNGSAAGTHHLHQDRFDHVDPGRVRAGRRLDRPLARDDVCAPRRHRRVVASDRRARHLSGGGSARL